MASHTYRFSGIQARMGILLIVTTTLIFGGFMAVYYHTTRSDMNSEISISAEFFANHLSASLVKPLWDTDEKTIEGIIGATMDEKQIYAIWVRDNLGKSYGKIRDENWKSIGISQISFPEWCIVKQKEIVRDNEKLGMVEICISPKFMQKKLNTAILKMLATLAILDTLLFLMLFFSIRKIIISPIRVIASYLGKIAVGNMPEKINEHYKGEFDEIRNSLNTLIEATKQTILAAEGIAAGDLTVEITERSEHDRMMQALNRMIRRLNDIMNETDIMIQAVGNGRLDIQGNAESFQGGWYELVTGVNHLIAGLSSAVATAASLSHEMELARRIQTSLLPACTINLHPDLDIAASMLPAEQVGGDFYDIAFDISGNLWIAIGDVSGHGVTPGLIMMMAQTVHATVTANLDCDARSVIVKTNEILYRNVHERLKETHFMTFIALKYLGKGRFQHAGAHLSMIVFRGQTGKCELIRTNGVYLNFKKDISRATKNSEFCLDPGDVLILYSDGLTESQNPDGEMLDLRGFVNIVKRHARRNPEAMKDMIMADVIQWCDDKRADDMTLVIVKQKEGALL